MWQALLQLLFPSRCVCCGKPAQGGALCCLSCREELDRQLAQPALLRFYSSQVWAAAPLAYRDQARYAVSQLKFHGRRDAVELLVPPMVRCVPLLAPEPPQLVVGVPMEPGKEKKRGYNQAELLGRALAQALELPYEAGLLCHVGTATQHELSARQRAVSVEHAFVPGPSIGLGAGKRILLVDDVLTTGQTMNRCRRLLLEAGAGWVGCVTAAMVPASFTSHQTSYL